MRLQKIPEKERQDIYPGNDDNEDAPIGYFVIKGDLIDLGVIYQWEIFFKPGGRSGFVDHAEVDIIKYLGREWFPSFWSLYWRPKKKKST